MLSSPVRNGFSHRIALAAADAAHAFHMRRRRAGAQLRADGAGAQLRMREVQVVLALGDVIGEFVADREAEPLRRAVGRDEVEADDFRFFAAIERETGRGQRLAAADHAIAIALVEPLGLRARRWRSPGRPPSTPHLNICIESDSDSAAAASFLCMLSRAAALP